MSVSVWELVLISLLAGLFIVFCLILGIVGALTGFKITSGSEVRAIISSWDQFVDFLCLEMIKCFGTGHELSLGIVIVSDVYLFCLVVYMYRLSIATRTTTRSCRLPKETSAPNIVLLRSGLLAALLSPYSLFKVPLLWPVGLTSFSFSFKSSRIVDSRRGTHDAPTELFSNLPTWCL